MELTNTRPAASRCLTEEAVGRIVARHGNEMLGVARRFSKCASDAEDAYQSALEVLLTKAPEGDNERLAAWLMVVVRNEALMIGRRHKHIDTTAFEEIADGWVADEPLLDERVLDAESLGRRREALRRLPPDHTRCLLLKADGMSYSEISRATGISYASVNRYLTDGRRAYRRVLGRIDSGDECRRLEPLLSLIADGEAAERERQDAKLHLQHCAACRTVLADFRATPKSIAAIFPVALAAPGAGGAGLLRHVADGAQAMFSNVQERLAGLATSIQPGAEVAMAKKVVVATAVAATLAAGGVGVGTAVLDQSADPERHEYVADPMLQPSSESGPTPSAGRGDEPKKEPGIDEKPVTPTVVEVLAAGGGDAATNEPDQQDLAANEDPFATEPQFDAPPDQYDDNAGNGEGEAYGGFTP